MRAILIAVIVLGGIIGLNMLFVWWAQKPCDHIKVYGATDAGKFPGKRKWICSRCHEQGVDKVEGKE